MLKKKLDVKLNFIDCLLILIAMYTVAPIVSRFISSYLTTYFYMLVVALFVALVLLINGLKSLNECMVMIFPFVCWKLLAFFVGSSGLINWGYASMLDIVPLLIGYYFTKHCDENKNALFAIFIFVLVAITLVTTIIGCMEYPGASRYLATVDDAQAALAVLYDWKNIGGYTFVYIAVLLHPFLILAYKKGKLKLWWALLGSIAIVTLAIYSEYTTALLLTLVTSLLYFFKKNFTAKQLLIFAVATMTSILLFSEWFADFLRWLADVVGSESIATRLDALASGRTGIENSEDNRIELYTRSLKTFFKNPLMGSLLNGGGGIGGHSFILDFIAQCGVVGIVILFYMYKTMYQRFFAQYHRVEGYGYVLWIFIQALILSTINTGVWIVILAFFGPIFLNVICGEEAKE